jgi:hypothetical protein
MVGMTRHKRRIAAWIACFAVLLASLAPSISHALVAAGVLDANSASRLAAGFSDANPASRAAFVGIPAPHPTPTPTRHHASQMEGMQMEGMDMAGVAGVEAAPSTASHSPASHSPAMHFEHCPFCFVHAGTFGLPLAAGIVIPTSGVAAIAPRLFYRAPQPLFAWTAAQPRAPPIPS